MSQRNRHPQRGIAVLLVMVVMASLLVGGTVGLSRIVSSIRGTANSTAGHRQTNCAESGLADGRAFFLAQKANWNTYLATGFRRTGQAGMGGSGPNYEVYLQDNNDELPPLMNNAIVDLDDTVLMISVCSPGTPDEQVERQFLTTRPLASTGFVYTTTNDKVDQLPVSAGSPASLQGNAQLAPVGGTPPTGLSTQAMALKLDGAGASAIFAYSPEMNGTKAIEVSLWFRADPAQMAFATLASKSHGAASGNTGWTVEFDGSGSRVQFGIYTVGQPGGVSTFSAHPLNDDRWHYLVGRYDGQRVALYIDSVLQGWTSASGDIRTNGLELSVGRWLGGSPRFFKGFLSGLRIRSWSDAVPIFFPLDGGMAMLFGATAMGQDLVFGGAGRAQILDSPALSGTKGLEVDFWFLADPTQPAYADVLSKGHGAASSNTGWNVEFENTTGRLGFGIYLTVTPPASSRVLSLRPVNDNQWHRFRGVYDGQTISLFIDDLLQGRMPASGDILTNSKVLTLGAWEMGPSRFFRGRLRDLTVRSFSEAVQGYEDGLVVLDQNVTQTTGHDSQAQAMVFNGTNAWARIPDNFTTLDRRPLDGPSGVEVSLWMRANSAQGAYATLASKSHGAASSNTGWSMEFDNLGRRVQFGVFTTVGTTGVFSRQPLNDNLWHEMKGVYDGRFVYLYVDRVLQGRAALSGTVLANTKPATVGRWELGPSRYYRGQMDSLRINPLYTLQVPNATERFLVGQFSPGAGYGIGSGSWVKADLNGDRMDDFVHLCCGNYVHTWISKGDGTFNVGTFYPPTGTASGYSVQAGTWRVGDFNGDGKDDLAHICCNNYIHPWISNGNGTFAVSTFYPPNGSPTGYYVPTGGWDSWKTGDFNGDGKTDLIHLCCANYVHPWISNGNGTFTVATFYPPNGVATGYGVQSGNAAFRWQVGDFNGDGKTDLVHVCCTNYVHPWFSNGNGTFTVATFYPPSGVATGYGVQSGSWLTGDFNGDGVKDLLHRCCSNYVHPWLSLGTGAFTVGYFSPGGGYAVQNGEFQVGDLNEDGIDDVTHVVYGTSYVHQWIGNGMGAFSVGYFSPWAGYGIPSGRFLMADINRDRKSDLIHLVASDYIHPWLSRN